MGIAVVPEITKKFTFANDESNHSVSLVGIPHDAGGVTDAHPDARRFWFHAVDGPGPLLIGLDYLETYKAIVDHHRGLMLLGDGVCWALERIPSGHWGFDLLKKPRRVQLNGHDALLSLASQQE